MGSATLKDVLARSGPRYREAIMSKFRPWTWAAFVGGSGLLTILVWELWSGTLRLSGEPAVMHEHGPHGGEEHIEQRLTLGRHGGVLLADGDLTVELAREIRDGRP